MNNSDFKYFKYWGKKSKVVFKRLINEFSNVGDTILDPFAGSGTTFFSSKDRKVFLRDIDNVQKFIFDNTTSKISEKLIRDRTNEIINKIKNNDEYKSKWCINNETIKSYRIYSGNFSYYMNGKWVDTNREEIICKTPIDSFKFKELLSDGDKYVKSFKSEYFRSFWDEYSLFVLNLIYKELSKSHVDKAIFTGFLKACHLSSKANSYRKSRPTSSGWGRPELMNLKNRIVINPLILLERAIFGSQGLIRYKEKISKYNKGSYEIFNIYETKKDERYDLIITDPPYSDIIDYGKLSLVWSVWLSKYLGIKLEKNEKISKEKSLELIKQLLNISSNNLKIGGTLVFSYNSKDVNEFEYIKEAIDEINNLSLIRIKKIRIDRSSESNVGKENWHNIDRYFVIRRNDESKR